MPEHDLPLVAWPEAVVGEVSIQDDSLPNRVALSGVVVGRNRSEVSDA